MHKQIEPLIITIKPWRGYDYITLKTSGKIPDLESSLEEKWKAIAPYEDFSFFTLKSYISEAYESVKAYMYMLLILFISGNFYCCLRTFWIGCIYYQKAL